MSEKIIGRVEANLYGLLIEKRLELYKRIIATLSKHIPEKQVDAVCELIDCHANQIHRDQGEW